MTNNKISSSFIRSPHDKEHPYAITSRDLIRDESISPNCRWMLIYLLSMKDGWEVKFSHIRQHVQDFIGRDQLYKIVDEAIEAGYIKKEQQYIGNLRRGLKYYVSETPIFKKSLPDLKESFRDPACEESHQQDSLSIPSQDVSPPPLPAHCPSLTLRQAAGRGSPDGEQNEESAQAPLPAAASSFEDELRETFRKAFENEDEKVERAMNFYKNHPEKLLKKDNPLRFVIFAIRNDVDLEVETEKAFKTSLEAPESPQVRIEGRSPSEEKTNDNRVIYERIEVARVVAKKLQVIPLPAGKEINIHFDDYIRKCDLTIFGYTRENGQIIYDLVQVFSLNYRDDKFIETLKNNLFKCGLPYEVFDNLLED